MKLLYSSIIIKQILFINNNVMKKILIIIFLIIVLSRIAVFPLSAGSRLSGVNTIFNLENLETVVDKQFVAVIIEPRKNRLIQTVDMYMKKLPNVFFQIYHGNKNKDVLEKYKDNPNIELVDMKIDNLTIQGYSRLLCSEQFWNTVRSENCLIFQTDSMPCDYSKFRLEDFIDYDYIGAPCPFLVTCAIKLLFICKGYIPESYYYNGGLSFRKRSKMIEVIKKYPWDGKITEDLWFCHFLPKIGGKLPDLETARKFSYEAEENLNYIPFGLHKPRKNWKKLEKICPGFQDIFVPAHTDYRNLYMI